MKYKIKSGDSDKGFAPYEVTIVIESREEAIILHDCVVTEIAKSGEFVRDIYLAISGRSSGKMGTIPLKDHLTI